MDHSWLKLRRRGLGVAVALTCASGLPLSGCLKTARSVAGLGSSASEAAIQAEKELTEKRRQEALFSQDAPKSDTPTARIRLPDTAEGTPSTSNEPLVAAVESGPVRQVSDSDADPWKKPNVVDPFIDRGTGRTAPLDAAAVASSSNNTSSAKSGSRIVGPTPPDDWESNPWADPPAAATAGSASGTPEWARTGGAETVAKEPQSALAAPPKDDADRQRVQALMAEAQAHQIRGEMHAAYRSALLAERVAEEAKVTFAQGEQSPRELAKEISDRIWNAPHGTSRKETQKPVEPLPTISPMASHAFASVDSFAQWRSVSPAQANSPAVLPNSVAPPASAENAELPQIRAASGASDSNRSSAVAGAQVHPQRTETAHALTAPLQFPEVSGKQIQPDGRGGASGNVTDPSVEFAIARSSTETSDIVIPGESGRAPVTQPAPFPVDISGLIDSRSRNVVQADKERPVLLAPGGIPGGTQPAPSPVAPAAFRIPTGESPSWEAIKETFSADDPTHEGAPAVSGSSGLKWGVVGVIAAILATLVGVKMSQSSTQTAPPTDAAPPEAETMVKEEEERHPLRIKRAA